MTDVQSEFTCCVYCEPNLWYRLVLIRAHCLPFPTDSAFYPPVQVIFSQIKTWFKDLSATDLVISGKWKAHADRPVAGLSVGVHREQCSPCVLAFSSLTRQPEHLHPQLCALAFVSRTCIKSFKCSHNVMYTSISIVNPLMAQHVIQWLYRIRFVEEQLFTESKYIGQRRVIRTLFTLLAFFPLFMFCRMHNNPCF